MPDYPLNIKVLMDSWRYQTLLAQNNATTSDNTAVWTTENTEGSDTVSQDCEIIQSSVYVTCACSNSSVVFWWSV